MRRYIHRYFLFQMFDFSTLSASCPFLLLIWIIPASVMLKVFCASPKKPCWLYMNIFYCVFEDKCHQSAKWISGIWLCFTYTDLEIFCIWNLKTWIKPLSCTKRVNAAWFTVHLPVQFVHADDLMLKLSSQLHWILWMHIIRQWAPLNSAC